MNRLTAMLVLLTRFVPAIVLAQDTGVVTSCYRGGNTISNDTIWAARSTGQGAAWNVFTMGYTGLYDNEVEWAAVTIPDADDTIPTGWYWEFMAKHPIGGNQGYYYSEWSYPAVYYGIPDTFVPVVLDLSRTSPPGNPHW